MIDDIKSAIESANTIALAGMRTGEEIGRRESAIKIDVLRKALQVAVNTLLANGGPTAGERDYAVTNARQALQATEQGR